MGAADAAGGKDAEHLGVDTASPNMPWATGGWGNPGAAHQHLSRRRHMMFRSFTYARGVLAARQLSCVNQCCTRKLPSLEAGNARVPATLPEDVEYFRGDAIQLGEPAPLLLVGSSEAALDRPVHAPLQTNCLRRGLLRQPDLMAQVGENQSVFLDRYEIGHADAQSFSSRGKRPG